MKEYRVLALFEKVYQPRTYRRKIVNTQEEAEELLKRAKEYYSTYPYLISVQIQEREVSEWSSYYEKAD